jgi:hypothetical protein
MHAWLLRAKRAGHTVKLRIVKIPVYLAMRLKADRNRAPNAGGRLANNRNAARIFQAYVMWNKYGFPRTANQEISRWRQC